MKLRSLLLYCSAVLFLLVLADRKKVYAEWDPNIKTNNTIADDSEACRKPKIIAAESGYYWIVWLDARNETASTDYDFDIYFQKINSRGDPQLTANGVPLVKYFNNQGTANPLTASDNIDYQSNQLSNNLQEGEGLNAEFDICGDGSGGFVCAWIDARNFTGLDTLRNEIWAQRVTSNGTLTWGKPDTSPGSNLGDGDGILDGQQILHWNHSMMDQQNQNNLEYVRITKIPADGWPDGTTQDVAITFRKKDSDNKYRVYVARIPLSGVDDSAATRNPTWVTGFSSHTSYYATASSGFTSKLRNPHPQITSVYNSAEGVYYILGAFCQQNAFWPTSSTNRYVKFYAIKADDKNVIAGPTSYKNASFKPYTDTTWVRRARIEPYKDGTDVGAFLAWENSTSNQNHTNSNICIQKLRVSGSSTITITEKWDGGSTTAGSQPVVIYGTADSPSGEVPSSYINVIHDGAGGAILAWVRHTDNKTTYDIVATRINSAGTFASGWTDDTNNFIYVAQSGGTQGGDASDGTGYAYDGNLTIVSDGNEGAVFTWKDESKGTGGATGSSDYIVSMRIKSDGSRAWVDLQVPDGTTNDDVNGVPLSANNGSGLIFNTLDMASISQGTSGIITVWSINTSSSGTMPDIRAGIMNMNSGVVGSTPNDPTNGMATPTDTTALVVNWKDKSNIETGYVLDFSTDGSNFTRLKSDLPADSTSFSHGGLSESITYYYKITAFNSVGYSNPSNTIVAQTLPSVPTDLKASKGKDFETTLTWKDNSVKEKGFVIYRKNVMDPNDSYHELARVGSNVTSYTDSISTNLANRTLFYKVAAYTDSGMSAFSNETFFDVGSEPPPDQNKKSHSKSSGGGAISTCYIATASHTTMHHPAIAGLVTVRSEYLNRTTFGALFSGIYAGAAPSTAAAILENDAATTAAKAILAPIEHLSGHAFALAAIFSLLMLLLATRGLSR